LGTIRIINRSAFYAPADCSGLFIFDAFGVICYVVEGVIENVDENVDVETQYIASHRRLYVGNGDGDGRVIEKSRNDDTLLIFTS
jgi:hypothetical protein